MLLRASLLLRVAVIVAACVLSPVSAMEKSPAAIQRVSDPQRAGMASSVRIEDAPLIFSGQLFARDLTRDATSQLEQLFDQLDSILREAGGTASGLIRLNLYVSDDAGTAAVERLLADRFRDAPPAVTLVRSPLAREGAQVACDVVGVGQGDVRAVEKIGQLTVMPRGGKVFVSGQAKRGASMAESVRETMEALHDSLGRVGADRSHVVQVKAFVNPMSSHADALNEIEKSYAGGRVPAIVVTEWLTKSPTEIELIVAGPTVPPAGGLADSLQFHWLPGMPVSPYYSRITTVAAGTPLIFMGCIDGGPDGTPRDQWWRAFSSLARALRDSGSSFRHMAKATYYLAEPAARDALAEIRNVFYDPARPPAASAVDVQSISRGSRAVALDMIAVPAPRAPTPAAPVR